MAEVVLNTVFQFKRGSKEAWSRNNPILRQGEPGYELDTGKLKIGNGVDSWNTLEYFDGDYAISIDGKSIAFNNAQLELYGFNTAAIGYSPRKAEDGTIEWFKPATNEDIQTIQQILIGDGETGGIQDSISKLEKDTATLSVTTKKIKYEITSQPESTLIDYRDKEIRIMCPADTQWEFQNSGAGADSNSYYIGLKAYAPNDDIVSFKEDLNETIMDQTMYYFEGNDFAGVDEYGRKYSIVWLPVASYNASTQTWTYYGSKSTETKYIGWYYSVEWYNADGNKVGADTIRISLSNETCHNNITPYYLGEYQKISDSISVSRLVNDDNTVLVFNGGSAEI